MNRLDMVVIRLSRGGAKKRPFYKVVVADQRCARDGRYLEQVGFFNPIAVGGEHRLDLKQERVDYWLKIGAQPSERVAALLKEGADPEKAAQRKALRLQKNKLRLMNKAAAKNGSANEGSASA